MVQDFRNGKECQIWKGKEEKEGERERELLETHSRKCKNDCPVKLFKIALISSF